MKAHSKTTNANRHVPKEMYLGGAVFLLPILATLSEGLMMNFEDEVREYIKKLNKSGTIQDYGYTKEYGYWRAGDQSTIGQPVKAKVGTIRCVDNVNNDPLQNSVERGTCSQSFKLSIDNGIKTPFHLKAVFSFPITGNTAGHNQEAELDGETTIEKTLETKRGKAVSKTCAFKVDVDFQGTIAIRIKGRNGKLGFYIPAPVSELANENYLIHYWVQGYLRYEVNGTYTETYCVKQE
uniref:DA-P36 family member n=1 Tax=Rhipicephalus appendiculatus TaxID=34631 RepID=A0A131YRQ7_RHIAP